MTRLAIAVVFLLAFGAVRLPIERRLAEQHHQSGLRTAGLNLGLREELGQLGFVAALSGFRSVVADFAFIEAHVAWERTEWGRVLLLFGQATTLQPHAVLFWDMAAWHMAWNASVAALQDPKEPRETLRRRAQRAYIELGKDFLERGIRNNPESAQLYEALARLYKDKLNDHQHASECFDKAADLPGAHSYARRFAAYELSYCEGREREAYDRLRALYDAGENQRLPTLINRLKVLEEKLGIPPAQRILDQSR